MRYVENPITGAMIAVTDDAAPFDDEDNREVRIKHSASPPQKNGAAAGPEVPVSLLLAIASAVFSFVAMVVSISVQCQLRYFAHTVIPLWSSSSATGP